MSLCSLGRVASLTGGQSNERVESFIKEFMKEHEVEASEIADEWHWPPFKMF